MWRVFLIQHASTPARGLGLATVAISLVFGCVALKEGSAIPPSGGNDASSTDTAPAQLADATMIDAFADATGAVDDGSSQKPEAMEATARDAADDHSIEAAGDQDGWNEAPADSEVIPQSVAPSHLMLWLTARSGVRCESSRVTRWADQSDHHDDATLKYNQLGPQCQLAVNPHRIGGIDLPYFSAPTAFGNVVDETLDVDLGFLVNKNYTMFAVERRWADYPDGTQMNAECFLGTDILDESQSWCGASAPNSAFSWGYDYYRGYTELFVDQHCNGLSVTAIRTPVPPPIGLGEETITFDAAWGHELRKNGTIVGVSGDLTPMAFASGGAIGRGPFHTIRSGEDTRFRGDIAEIVVYDTALDDTGRTTVEMYLKNHWAY